VKRFYAKMDEEKREALTVATAIEINRPVNLSKCLRALHHLNGVVAKVSDEEILEAKAVIGSGGLGCEPASAAGVAGLRKLVEQGVIRSGEQAVCVVTGHHLKAPDVTVNYHALKGDDLKHAFGVFGVTQNERANRPVEVDNDLTAILKVLGGEAHGSWDG
jgi:threonine synthase